jgi:flagellar protein FliT
MTPSRETQGETPADAHLLHYYEAIERASAQMLQAARAGDWESVMKLEGATVLLISQLKQEAQAKPLPASAAKAKSKIMQRILLNDAEMRQLAEPWLKDLDDLLAARPKTLH